jgi:hypothetical protein
MSPRYVCVPVLIALLLAGGYAQADFYVGSDAFRRGDYATALKELTPEVEKNNADAIAILAKMYQGGFGVTKDIVKATALFKRAAELGDADSAYAYGVARAIGDGVEPDLGEGLKWLYIAQTLGSDKALAYLKKLRMPREMIVTAKLDAAKWHSAFKKKREAKLKAEEAAMAAAAKKAAAAAKAAEKGPAKQAEPAGEAAPAADPAGK